MTTSAQSQPVIIKAHVGKMPKDIFDDMPVVTVHFDNDPDTPVGLFQYYPDEISFSAGEFIGKTRHEAFKLFHEKDTAYLRS